MNAPLRLRRALRAFALLSASLALAGCAAPKPAVIPEGDALVPVRRVAPATGEAAEGPRRLYLEEPTAACDGWYVPKATLIRITNRLMAD